jgi:hypothetical protein
LPEHCTAFTFKDGARPGFQERERKSIVGVEIYDGNRDTYTVGLVSIAWKEEEEGIIIKRGQADRANHTHTHTLCLFLYKERDPTI